MDARRQAQEDAAERGSASNNSNASGAALEMPMTSVRSIAARPASRDSINSRASKVRYQDACF